jgi:ribosomal protein S18 acetylase RimI-like enzyme
MKPETLRVMISIADLNNHSTLDGVWSILCDCNKEFYPPLSLRDSTNKIDLVPYSISDSAQPDEYFESLRSQSLIVAQLDCKILGFMSFWESYSCPELNECVPSNHVTTACVSPKARRQGICFNFYQFMFKRLPKRMQSSFVSTRTSNVYYAHLYLLNKMGFTLATKLENHRGVGIHTFYYAKKCDYNLCNA